VPDASKVVSACRRPRCWRVGDLGEVAEQVTALLGCQRSGHVQPLGASRYGDVMEGQARSSGLVMGFDNHMIARSRACSTFSPAHSPDYYQPDKPALCRGPGLAGEGRKGAGKMPGASPLRLVSSPNYEQCD
jgi:hypothetical protein